MRKTRFVEIPYSKGGISLRGDPHSMGLGNTPVGLKFISTLQ
jgi:hypothetical protein